MKSTGKEFKMPNVYTLIILFIIVSALLTSLYPPSKYNTYLDGTK